MTLILKQQVCADQSAPNEGNRQQQEENIKETVDKVTTIYFAII
jgi:hypothetical protein